MVRKIIAFSGRMHAGKDTAGEYLCNAHNFRRFAFADALKKGVQQLTGFSNEQLWGEAKDSIDDFYGITPRQVLQDIGMFMREMYTEEFWIRRFIRFANEHPDQDIVITDVRFENEVQMIKGLDGYVVRIWRPETMNEIIQHTSEKQDFDVDAVILNDSTKSELYKQIDDLLSTWYDIPPPRSLTDSRHFMDD